MENSPKPFRPLEEFQTDISHGFSKIEQGVGHPEILVKEITHILTSTYTFDDFKREVVEPIEAANDYGLGKFIPYINSVWGLNDEGQERGFLVTKRVFGENIEDVTNISLEIAEELDKFLSLSLVVASITLRNTDMVILPDISFVSYSDSCKSAGLINIVIGKTDSDTREHVYLVDLYPLKDEKERFDHWDVNSEKIKWEKIIENLSKLSKEYNFPETRQALGNWVASIRRHQRTVVLHTEQGTD